MHLYRFEQIVRGRLQLRLGRARVRNLAFEPRIEMLVPQYYRHAAMQGSDSGIGIAGDDGESVDLAARSVPPALPDRGKGDQAALARTKQEGAPRALWPGPFVEPVRRHEAAPRGLRILTNCGSNPQRIMWQRRWPSASRHTANVLRRRDIVPDRKIRRVAIGKNGAHR